MASSKRRRCVGASITIDQRLAIVDLSRSRSNAPRLFCCFLLLVRMSEGQQTSLVTSFERLPDELLLLICSYLSPFEVLKSVNDLNTRLNSTISTYRQHVDLRSLTLRQFYSVCKWLRVSFGDQLRSLVLSNAVPAVRQLLLFRKQIDPFEDLLSNLERLVLIDHYDDELDLYLPVIYLCEHLKELKISFVKNQNETTLSAFLSQLLANNFLVFEHSTKRRKRETFSLEKLSLTGTGYLKLMPIYNDTIRHLTIEIDNLDDLVEIFAGFDRLESLNVNMKQLTVSSMHCSEPTDSQRKTQCPSLLDFRFQSKWQPEKFTFEHFSALMKNLPHLRHCSCTFKSEVQEENILNSSYVKVDHWRRLCDDLLDLVHFDCVIKSPVKSSNTLERDFLKIKANVCRTSDRTTDVQLYYFDERNPNTKTEVEPFFDRGERLISLSLLVASHVGIGCSRIASDDGLTIGDETLSKSRIDVVQRSDCR